VPPGTVRSRITGRRPALFLRPRILRHRSLAVGDRGGLVADALEHRAADPQDQRSSSMNRMRTGPGAAWGGLIAAGATVEAGAPPAAGSQMRKRGALSHGRFDGDVSEVLLDDGMDRCEAKAASLFLCREIGVENPLQVFRRDSRPWSAMVSFT